MAGVTNYPFRALCRGFGAGLYVSEMITARGFLNGNRPRAARELASRQSPRSVQIYGTDPRDVGEMARAPGDEGVDHLDMNFGCPVPKVTRTAAAAPCRSSRACSRAWCAPAVQARGRVPVTIKVRKGIDEAAHLPRRRPRGAGGGRGAIGLHARTAAQLYSGEADWDAIGELAAAVRSRCSATATSGSAGTRCACCAPRAAPA
jgi:tRNA-dihydrouridine synthase